MIRRCELSDKEIWCKLNKEFMEYEYEDENLWENPLKKGNPEEIFETVINDPNSPNMLFMLEEENCIIGFMNTVYFTSVWAHGKVLFIDDFFITEQYRSRGYGNKALKELESLMREKGFKRFQLFAENTNPKAISFYEKEDYHKQELNLFCKYL